MRRTAVRTLEGAVSLSRARKPLSRSVATVKDPHQKVGLLASFVLPLVLILTLFIRTLPNSTTSQNFPTASASPPKPYLDLSRPSASTLMQAQDTRMKVCEV